MRDEDVEKEGPVVDQGAQAKVKVAFSPPCHQPR